MLPNPDQGAPGAENLNFGSSRKGPKLRFPAIRIQNSARIWTPRDLLSILTNFGLNLMESSWISLSFRVWAHFLDLSALKIKLIRAPASFSDESLD